MVLRIQRSRLEELTIFALCGNLDENYTSELKKLFGPLSDYVAVVLDLSDVRLADHAAVQFLAQCEAQGIRLYNCPGYIRKWITMEKLRAKKQSTDEQKD